MFCELQDECHELLIHAALMTLNVYRQNRVMWLLYPQIPNDNNRVRGRVDPVSSLLGDNLPG